MNYTNLIDSCQAHLPMQYASNIELIRQKWYWCCDWQRSTLESYMQNIEDIQVFGMNMPFISSSEAKNAYFMSGEATNEIYIFSLHEMK